jgi:hypothetical protein
MDLVGSRRMNAKRVKSSRIVALALALLVAGIAGWFLYDEYHAHAGWRVDEQICAKAMSQIGDVKLDMTTSYGQIERIFGKPHSIQGWNSGLVKNGVTAYWWGDKIQATFIGFVGKFPTAEDRDKSPVIMQVSPPFNGSLCGVHLGDTPEHFLGVAHPVASKDFTVCPAGSWQWRNGKKVDTTGEWQMSQNRVDCQARNGKIIQIHAENYTLKIQE